MENLIKEEWKNLDNKIKDEIKWIVKSHWKNGTAKSNAIGRIYAQITDYELPFDENTEDMHRAEKLYNYVLEKFILKEE